MRVLQVSGGPLAGGSAAGAERCCLELSRWLDSSGVEVTIAAPRSAGAQPFRSTAALRNATWRPLSKLFFDYVSPANTRRLRSAIDKVRPDVVHVHNVYGVGSQLVQVAAQRVPTAVTVHDYWPIDVFVPSLVAGELRYPRRHRLLRPWVSAHRALHRRHLRGAHLVSPSRYLARRLEQAGYRDVRVIPNGVTPPEQTTSGAGSILFVGRLVPEKGLQSVLPALEPLARELGWRIDVAGDGPLRAELERACPSVWFHGRTDPVPLYRQAGIAIMPSLWPENFPYAALEAMGHGVPVVASNVGGLPEMVQDGVSGRLCEPGAAPQFVAAVRQLASDSELRDRLGRAARERIAREFSWAQIGPRYLACYEELAQAAARPGATPAAR